MNERGSVTIWVLGLCLLVLTLGGLSVDLWRGISERRALYHVASAGAVAGASGIDTELWRSSGMLGLDPLLAEDMAVRAVAAQPRSAELTDLEVEVAESSIEVTVARPLRFTLLRLMGVDSITVTASAVAEPRLEP